MLHESCLHMGIPVVPVMPARMLVIRMLNTARFEKGMPAAIVIQEMILNSTVERKQWQYLWRQLIHKCIAIEIRRIA